MFSREFHRHLMFLAAWLVPACTSTQSPGAPPTDTSGSTGTTTPVELSPTEPTDPGDPPSTSSTTDAAGETTTTTSPSATSTTSLSPGGLCGDGALDDGEACDEGANNHDEGACKLDCTAAACGDGLVQAGVEACDDGPDNGLQYAGCSKTCTKNPYCGDGVKDLPQEQCDAGADNGSGQSEENSVPCTLLCDWDARMVFLSSTVHGADFDADPDDDESGLDGADEICRHLAWTTGHQRWKSFRAWLSDGELGALDRFTQYPVKPIMLPTGERVADSISDLILNGPGHGIRVDEFGASLPPSWVWTNTGSNGEIAAPPRHCADWSSASPDQVAHVGFSHVPSEPEDMWLQWAEERRWTSYPFPWNCDNMARLYCFEQ
jgi:cysteine-rich repeat protein